MVFRVVFCGVGVEALKGAFGVLGGGIERGGALTLRLYVLLVGHA